jgi:hypothetical protein
LIFVSDEGVLNDNEEFHKSSISTLSSGKSHTKDDINLDETVKVHSDLISTFLSTTYSIAISRLLAVNITFLY